MASLPATFLKLDNNQGDKRDRKEMVETPLV